MFTDLKQKFLFKCEDCAMIVSVEIEEEEEIKEIHENKFVFECVCGGKSKILRD
jgi:hypothetical protein